MNTDPIPQYSCLHCLSTYDSKSLLFYFEFIAFFFRANKRITIYSLRKLSAIYPLKSPTDTPTPGIQGNDSPRYIRLPSPLLFLCISFLWLDMSLLL